MKSRDIAIALPGGDPLPGTLTLPNQPLGIVAFAHGSGSSRLSPRNVFVAEVLHAAGVATLLFDLLRPDEDVDRAARFDIGLLTERLLAASDWLAAQAEVAGLALGYFGASTGAAAAVEAAAGRGGRVAAVVSRGGRPDLAGPGVLEALTAPTLLIVGGDDEPVLGLNRQALAKMRGPHRLVVVPGATHLFDEPGTLEQAARHASDWFVGHFAAPLAVRRHLLIHGRVQGVGFRAAMAREAARLGLAGWVRNRRDGSVEAFVVGKPDPVEAVVRWAYHGPRAAAVTRVDVSAPDPREDEAALTGFEQRPTV